MREYYCRSINWTIHTDVCIDVTVEILGISHAIDFNFWILDSFASTVLHMVVFFLYVGASMHPLYLE